MNAVSEWFEVEVSRENKVHHMAFSRGKTTQKMSIIGKTKKTGTKISWLPDPEIFLTIREFKYDLLAKRLRELAFLNPGINITLEDQRTNRQETFLFRDGIAEYVTFLNRGKSVVHPKPVAFTGDAGRRRTGLGHRNGRHIGFTTGT